VAFFKKTKLTKITATAVPGFGITYVIPFAFDVPKTLAPLPRCPAFFMLIGFRKQAFETSSHKKSLAASLQGFVARTGFEPVSPP
jgi:hypothetical protein